MGDTAQIDDVNPFLIEMMDARYRSSLSATYTTAKEAVSSSAIFVISPHGARPKKKSLSWPFSTPSPTCPTERC